MWDKIIIGAITLIGAAFVGYAVYEIYVAYLNRSKARKIAKKQAKEKFQNTIGKAVVEKLEKGNYKVAKIGLYNKSSKKVAEIKIKTDDLSNDLSEGDVLFT